jgi:LacI family transcriptional regulator
MAAVNARQVAELVGVSLSTVSRALSTPELVAAETRAKVEAAARDLGYRPNRMASSLATGRTTSVGLVVPDLENPYFASVAKGVQSRAWGAGYTVVVADSDEDPIMEVELVQVLARQVDGLVLCGPRSSDDAVAALAEQATLVLMNRTVPGIRAVSADNVQVALTAVSHLRALGHRRIAYAGGPDHSWSDARRREGLQQCVEQFGDIEVVDLGHFRPHHSGGVAAADLALASGATAVVAFNDLMATGLMARLRERGADVPGRLSVVGIDGLSIAGLVSPGLTTVSIPHAKLGAAAVQTLLAVLRGDSDASSPSDSLSSSIPMTVELVVRQSTAEPGNAGVGAGHR